MIREIKIWLAILLVWATVRHAFAMSIIASTVLDALSDMKGDLLLVGAMRLVAEITLKTLRVLKTGATDGRYF